MTHVNCVDAEESDPVDLPRYACPNCGTTAGLATIEQLDSTMPVRGITRGQDGTIILHTGHDDTVIDLDSSRTIGVLCRNDGCDFYHRGPGWADQFVYPIAAGAHPADDNLELG